MKTVNYGELFAEFKPGCESWLYVVEDMRYQLQSELYELLPHVGYDGY